MVIFIDSLAHARYKEWLGYLKWHVLHFHILMQTKWHSRISWKHSTIFTTCHVYCIYLCGCCFVISLYKMYLGCLHETLVLFYVIINMTDLSFAITFEAWIRRIRIFLLEMDVSIVIVCLIFEKLKKIILYLKFYFTNFSLLGLVALGNFEYPKLMIYLELKFLWSISRSIPTIGAMFHIRGI